MVGDPLNPPVALVSVAATQAAVEDFAAVPGDDMTELVRQREAPTAEAVVPVDVDLVLAVFPLGEARQRRHFVPGPWDDSYPWHVAYPEQIDRPGLRDPLDLQQLARMQFSQCVGVA